MPESRHQAYVVELDTAGDGLTARYSDGTLRTWAWSEVTRAEPTRDGLRVVFQSDPSLDLLMPHAACLELLEAVNHGVGLADDHSLPPAMIEAWLDVAPDTGWYWRDDRLGCMPTVVAGSVALGAWMMEWRPGYWLAVAALVGQVINELWVGRMGHEVSADGLGLTQRRRGRRTACAWADVTAIRAHRNGWTITYNGGTMDLGADQRAWQLATVIDRILNARAAGHGLPAEAPLTDTALSRAGGATEADDRSLSVAEGDHG
jgi:hypothetical protein